MQMLVGAVIFVAGFASAIVLLALLDRTMTIIERRDRERVLHNRRV